MIKLLIRVVLLIIIFAVVYLYMHWKCLQDIQKNYTGKEAIVINDNNNIKHIGKAILDDVMFNVKTNNEESIKKYDTVLIDSVKWNYVIVRKEK